jgi:hypothetical protein
MYSFVINIILFASLAFMIYMLARALPRITDAEHETITHTSYFDKMIDRLPMERIDIVISTYLEKLLRKFKIFVSKLDAVINGHLARVRKNSPIQKEREGAVLKEKMEAMAEAVEKSDDTK